MTNVVISIENIQETLYGCATLHLKESLEPQELNEMKEYLRAQYIDGWGEGFEQRDIVIDGGYLYVQFWNWETFQFFTRDELEVPQKYEGIPERKRLEMKLEGQNGNMYAILGRAEALLVQNGQKIEAKKMKKRVFASQSYHEALKIVSEYVETEISVIQDNKGKIKKVQEKGKSR